MLKMDINSFMAHNIQKYKAFFMMGGILLSRPL